MIKEKLAEIAFLAALVSIILGIILLSIRIPKESKWYDRRDFVSIGLMIFGLILLGSFYSLN